MATVTTTDHKLEKLMDAVDALTSLGRCDCIKTPEGTITCPDCALRYAFRALKGARLAELEGSTDAKD